MEYPQSFVQKIKGAFGEEGIQWLSHLHQIIEVYEKKWELTILRPVDNLSYNYVLNVKQINGCPAILKIGVPNIDFSNEINTLASYDGNGSVKLLRYEKKDGIMLLEKIIPGNMLFDLSEEEAIEQYATVWSKLPRKVNLSLTTPNISKWFSAFDRYVESDYDFVEYPPKKFVLEAKLHSLDFMNPSNEFLLHGDLHHENILYSEEKGWTVIDPKGVVGHLYLDFASFMVNHLPKNKDVKQVLNNRINRLSNLLHLDKQKLVEASFVMATLSMCWAIEDNDSYWRKVYYCAQCFKELLIEEC